MHYTGQVYRHPLEANTPLLEVTAGCSHNKCAFCNMYLETPFAISKKEHIFEDITEIKEVYGEVSRIFMVNGDAFVLATEKLVEILREIKRVIPEIKTIACYSSIKNLKSKSEEDLKILRKEGLTDLHIGIETGYDPALLQVNKGFTNEEAHRELTKISNADIGYAALIMLGIAGKGKSKENAKATAELLNKFKPYMVSAIPTAVSENTKLLEMAKNGEYLELTEREMLLEQIELISLLDVPDAYYFGGHYFNLVPVSGSLKYKDEFIKYLEEKLLEIPKEILDSTKKRGNI